MSGHINWRRYELSTITKRSERYTSATVCADSYVIMHISIHTSDCLGVIIWEESLVAYFP